jgi:RNA polymerase sigma factor (sigma-70 family)
LAVIPFARRTEPKELSDSELLALFDSDPRGAWRRFIDRYADLILSTLRYLGFDYDEAMDRFVYVCEKLSEDGFRRLREVRFAGHHGEIVPWIRTVVRHLSISWARSVEGRRRLFKSIERLPRFEQRVFELYFWHGASPSEMHGHLRDEQQDDVPLFRVFDALSNVFDHLDVNQRWRLASRLARDRTPVPVGSAHPEFGPGFEPIARETSPEQALLLKEQAIQFECAFESLAPRDRLVLQLRYEEALSLTEVAEVVHVSVSTVKNSVRASLARLREIAGRSPDGK